MSMEPNRNNILGNILRIYRERSRFQEKEIAEKLQITEDDVKDWESGKSEPNNYYRLLLSTLYSIPVNFLINDFNKNLDDSFSFRAVSGEQVFPEPYMYIFAEKAECIKNLFLLINKMKYMSKEKPLIKEKKFLMLDSFDEIEYLSQLTQIDEKAKVIINDMSKKFIEYYNLPNGAKVDLLKILPSKSATVIYTPVPEGYSGISFISADNHYFYIFVNSKDHYCKQTFTLIHEFGHVIFKEVKNKALIEDIINYFVNITLLPPSDMCRIFQDFSVDKIDDYMDRFKEISHKYEVSYKTILYSLYHIGKLGYNGNISDRIEQIMFKHFETDSAVTKLSYRNNILIHKYVNLLLDEGIVDDSYRKEINSIAPMIS